MKETHRSIAIELDATNPMTGEAFRVTGTQNETNTYYSVRKLTSRINAMDLLTTMANTCKSPKDIHILNSLLDLVGSDNIIRINSISTLAKTLEISRVKLTLLLKAFEDDNFFKKLDKGIYMVNPFVFVGKRVKSNELREASQLYWTELHNV